jgi:hypothetical protein
MARSTEAVPAGAAMRLTSVVLTVAACAGCGRGQPEAEPVREADARRTAPAGPDGVQIAYARHGDLVALDGTVSALAEDGFRFDYGVDTIQVRSREPILARLSEGETLRVTGRIDKSGVAPVLAAEAVMAEDEAGRFVPVEQRDLP